MFNSLSIGNSALHQLPRTFRDQEEKDGMIRGIQADIGKTKDGDYRQALTNKLAKAKSIKVRRAG